MLVIALVGQPNVGKSTLFNLLLGGKHSITHRVAGTSRDFLRGQLPVNTPSGTINTELIDTPGWLAKSEDPLQQQLAAISCKQWQQADIIVLVYDAVQGITATEQILAQQLRKTTTRPVLVVANKCESKRSQAGQLEGHQLGWGHPIAIAAAHGIGLADLLRELQAVVVASRQLAAGKPEQSQLPESESAVDNITVATHDPKSQLPLAVSRLASITKQQLRDRIVILGRPNSGKSTLVNQMLGYQRMLTGEQAGLTRDIVATPLSVAGEIWKLCDTPGLRRKANINEDLERLATARAIQILTKARIVVLLVDAGAGPRRQDAILADRITAAGCGLIIALNKIDSIAPAQRTQLLTSIKQQWMDFKLGIAHAPLLAISALRGTGIKRLLQTLEQVNDSYGRRIGTGPLNRWLQQAQTRQPPPRVRQHRPSLRYITQSGSRPPQFIIFGSRSASIPQHYLRYLGNNLRQRFDFTGVPIEFKLRSSKNPYIQAKS